MVQMFMKRAEVVTLVGLGYSTIWRLERAGGFPARRKLSPCRVAWVRSEVEAWVETRSTIS